MKNTKVSFHTIGCRLNQYETAVLRNSFEQKGAKIVSALKPADIAVVNTCTVTEKSDTDTRRFVNRLVRINPHVKIALIGCQAQLQTDILKKMPNVHWVVGNVEKLNLADIVSADNEAHVVVSTLNKPKPFRMKTYGMDAEHTRANLKIQDGCDNFCSYCEVPYARGAARSRAFKDIICEAEALAQFGHKEIILTGINLGAYQYQKKTLIDIVKALEDISKLKRIRISSIEPTDVLERLITYMSGKTKLCRYLHVPLQHGHDSILKSMKRKYSVETLRRIISSAYAMIPDICIGTDVIVGFPGESELHFQETYNLMRVLPVNYFHVFSFSKRKNAVAKDLKGQVPNTLIQKRSAKLRSLSQRKRRQFYQRMLGKTMTVLFEQKKDYYWQGLTDNFIRVRVFSKKDFKNCIRRVKLNNIDGQYVTGSLLTKELK